KTKIATIIQSLNGKIVVELPQEAEYEEDKIPIKMPLL
ncbi:unnamed protein product, partial [marine sediment metagenome]